MSKGKDMAVHEVNAVLELTNAQEKKAEDLIERLREQGEWTTEKILEFIISGLVSDMVDEMLNRFEKIVEMGERQQWGR